MKTEESPISYFLGHSFLDSTKFKPSNKDTHLCVKFKLTSGAQKLESLRLQIFGPRNF